MSLIHVLESDYSSDLPIKEKSFYILFSFYAGFISLSCKKYLKPNGILICNSSHGPTSIAYVYQDFELIGVIKRNGNAFRIKEEDVHMYFMKKDESSINRARGKG